MNREDMLGIPSATHPNIWATNHMNTRPKKPQYAESG